MGQPKPNRPEHLRVNRLVSRQTVPVRTGVRWTRLLRALAPAATSAPAPAPTEEGVSRSWHLRSVEATQKGSTSRGLLTHRVLYAGHLFCPVESPQVDGLTIDSSSTSLLSLATFPVFPFPGSISCPSGSESDLLGMRCPLMSSLLLRYGAAPS